ncbi:hypothetical protein [uncultured Thiodictyon sp.]|uniref:hypothetical protein n=1 Tax=uncultured Thiodictyon sp. TaxID=1846217 RepID=UPI0025CEB06A|nr:hypothetical protein [uncultured Thiodictyon sp.]
MNHLSRPLIPLLICLWPLSLAAEPFAGSLIAERDCPASISTKQLKNPGEIRLVPGQTYKIVARNKAAATHYQLRIESAPQSKDRWVEVSCGRLGTSSAAPTPPAPAAAPPAMPSKPRTTAPTPAVPPPLPPRP